MRRKGRRRGGGNEATRELCSGGGDSRVNIEGTSWQRSSFIYHHTAAKPHHPLSPIFTIILNQQKHDWLKTSENQSKCILFTYLIEQ